MPPKLRRFGQEQARQRAAAHERQRGSAASRGYGRRWRRLRKRFLDRHPLCQDCHAHGWLVGATDVDHIVPKRRGGTDDESNLQALCHRCHSRKTAKGE